MADSISRRPQVLSTERTLHLEVCRVLWRQLGMPLIELFATSQNYRLPAFVSPFPDPMAIATNSFLFSWDHMELYAFPPFPAIRRLLSKLRSSRGTSVILFAPIWPSKEWFPDLLQETIDTPCLLPMRPDPLWQPYLHCFHDGFHAFQLTVWKLSIDSFTVRATPGELRPSW